MTWAGAPRRRVRLGHEGDLKDTWRSGAGAAAPRLGRCVLRSPGFAVVDRYGVPALRGTAAGVPPDAKARDSGDAFRDCTDDPRLTHLCAHAPDRTDPRRALRGAAERALSLVARGPGRIERTAAGCGSLEGGGGPTPAGSAVAATSSLSPTSRTEVGRSSANATCQPSRRGPRRCSSKRRYCRMNGPRPVRTARRHARVIEPATAPGRPCTGSLARRSSPFIRSAGRCRRRSVSSFQVSVSVRPDRRGEAGTARDAGHHSRFVPLLHRWPPRHAAWPPRSLPAGSRLLGLSP